MKTQPRPSSLTRSTRPPCACATCSAKCRPSPVPGASVCPRTKRPKRSLRSRRPMPGPSSETERQTDCAVGEGAGLDPAALAAVLDGVVEQVQDGAADGFRVPGHGRQRSGRAAGEGHVAPLGSRRDERDRGAHQLVRLDGREAAAARSRAWRRARARRAPPGARSPPRRASPYSRGSPRPWASRSPKRRMAASGVRSSWVTLARNLFSRAVARASAARRAPHGQQAGDRRAHRDPEGDAKGAEPGDVSASGRGSIARAPRRPARRRTRRWATWAPVDDRRSPRAGRRAISRRVATGTS